MMRLTAAEVTAAVGGELLSGSPDAILAGVCIDSRKVGPGCLFVPLPGARVDGHEFVAGALADGASGSLTARDPGELAGRPPGARSDAVLIRVAAPLAALQDLALEWRLRLRARVVGIAGSNGKTTTKQVVAAVLGTRFRTFATPGNENSQIGTPLAILAAPADVEALVLELGTSMPGELGRLARFARPDLAVITAAFAEHLEFLGSLAGVIDAETEILDGLAPGSLALVGSAEPALVAAARRREHLDVRSLGLRGTDDLRLSAIEASRTGTQFQLSSHAGEGTGLSFGGSIPLLGEPAAWAAGFAVAVGFTLGLETDEIRRGLEQARPAAHRLVPRQHPSRSILVLDDCYNANPASCIAAVRTLRAIAAPGDRLLLVLGDMLELGEESDEAHRQLGEALGSLVPGETTLLAVGPASVATARAATRAGLRAEALPDATAATARLVELLGDGRPSAVLVKGSRGIALETTVDAILAAR